MKSNNKILIVDDEDSARKALKRTFRNADIQVEAAESGKQALQIMEKENFNLVIADLKMPDMNGIEFLSLVHQLHPFTSQILLSGQSLGNNLVKAFNQCSIKFFIPKPWNQQDLLNVVSQVMKENHCNQFQGEIDEPTLEKLAHLNDTIELLVGAFVIWDKSNKFVLNYNNNVVTTLMHTHNTILDKNYQKVLIQLSEMDLIPFEPDEQAEYLQECLEKFSGKYRSLTEDSIVGRPFSITYVQDSDSQTAIPLFDITEQAKRVRPVWKDSNLNGIRTLAGGIAHNFNNILMPILGYSELLMDREEKSSKDYSYINFIFNSAVKAKDLVSEILLFSRLSHTAKTVTDLRSIVSDVIQLSRVNIDNTTLITAHISPDPMLVSCDPNQIHKALMNICSNANQSLHGPGKIKITLDAARATNLKCITNLLNGMYVRIAISDNGEGMNEELLNRIFDPFFTTRGDEKKLGLGLSSVFGTIHNHEGGIIVTSKPGEGTTFEIYLPCANGPEKKPTSKTI